MKHMRYVTLPRMAVEYKADAYKQDSFFAPFVAAGKLVALVAGTVFGLSSLLSGFRTEL